jgi:hypothetical protein
MYLTRKILILIILLLVVYMVVHSGHGYHFAR